jgi:hypothetical protein
MAIWTYLIGKKSYIIGIATIVYAITGLILGHVDSATAAMLISGSLMGMGIRHGVSTTILGMALSQVPTVTPDVAPPQA